MVWESPTSAPLGCLVVDKPVRVCARHRLEFRVRVKLFDDRSDVTTDGRVLDPEADRNVSVARSRGKKSQDIVLSPREPAEQRGPLLARPFQTMTAVREREHVRHRLHELQIVPGEVTSGGRVGTQNAERNTVPANKHAESTHHPVVAQEWRGPESCLDTQVGDDDWLVALEGVPGVRLQARSEGRPTNQSRLPPRAGSQKQSVASREELKNAARLDLQRFRHTGGGRLK